MKKRKRILSTLLSAVMLMSTLVIPALATNEVIDSPFVSQSVWESSSGDWLQITDTNGKYTAADATGSVSVDIGGSVTDMGGLTFTIYAQGLSSRTFTDTTGKTTPTATVSDPSVVDVEVGNTTYNNNGEPIMYVTFTGLSDGVVTVTIPYRTSAYIETSYTGIGQGETAYTYGTIIYTVTVGDGVTTEPDSGDGDEDGDDDYGDGWVAIESATDLRNIENNTGTKYYLANDIDLNSNRNSSNRGGWDPIGSTSQPFSGILDGCGHTISGFDSTLVLTDGDVGLFAVNDGIIRDLTVEVGNVVAVENAGVICGTNNGLIEDVYVSGEYVAIYTLYDYNAAGGLVGVNTGTIQRCSAQGLDVICPDMSGGLVGENSGEIYDSFSTCSVNADYQSSITSGSTYSYWYAGGLVGQQTATGTTSGCYVYAKGSISASYNAGGFIGLNYSTDISNCYVAHNDLVYGSGLVKEAIGGGTKTSGLDIAYVAPSTSDEGYGFAPISSVSALFDTDLMTITERSDGRTAYLYKEADGYDYPVLYWQVEGWEEDELPSETKEYTVTYLPGLDGETVTGYDSITVEDGSKIALDIPVHESADGWTYYAFTGWELDGDIYDDYTVESDVTFTATWVKTTVNGDAYWTYLDAMAIMDYLASSEGDDFVYEMSDRNNDGTTTYLDAMAVMDYLAVTTSSN